jgi:drug/metabolite transporter (DMT)-like permease
VNASASIPPVNPRRGVILLLIAASLWSTNAVFIKGLHDGGMHGAAIASFRSLIAAAFLTPFAWRRRHRVTETGWVVGAVLLFTGMCASFVIATTLTTAANAIILQYTAPAWVLAFAPWINRERTERRQWFAFVAAMLAVALIFAMQFTSDPVGLSVSLLSGMVFGLQVVFFRRVRRLDPVVFIWWCCAGSGLALLPVALWVGGAALSAGQLGLVVVTGVVQFGLPYVIYAAGSRHVSAQRAVLIIMLEPVLNPVWAYVVRGEIPHPSTIVGGAVILCCVTWISIPVGKTQG